MSYLFYVFKGRTGLYDMGYAPRTGGGHESEEALSYLAVVGYWTACMLACTLSCPATLSCCGGASTASTASRLPPQISARRRR